MNCCEGWGTIGKPPNVCFCDCAAGRELRQQVTRWRFPIFGGVKADKKGPAIDHYENYTPERYLELVNAGAHAMPRAIARPAAKLAETLRSGTVVPRRQREPGDESEYE